MNKIFLTILNMSLTGAFVIAAICIARLPLKKAPKIISYCLWAVAGFRLLFPFSIESIYSLIPFQAQTIPTDIATQAEPRIESGIPYLNNAASSILPAAAPEASVNPLHSGITIAATIWLIVFAAMLFYGIISFFILKRRMKQSILLYDNIFESEQIQTPFVLGIIKPKIYLPVGLKEKEQKYILLHEQTHIRRKDHIVKFFAYFILCLHWFNPLVWLAFLLMGVDMEMSCDESVLKALGEDIKKEYSLSLLSLATQRHFVGASPLAFGEGNVKRRILNVLHFKKSSRVIILISVAILIVLSIGLAVNRIVDRHFSMQGNNLSDIQTDEIIIHISNVTNASDDIMVPIDNCELHVTSNFDWVDAPAFSLFYSKDDTVEQYYTCQLHIDTENGTYTVNDAKERDSIENYYLLSQWFDALKYLPQEYIQSLAGDADQFILVLQDGVILNDNLPCVFYDKNGITDNQAWCIRFDIQALYLEDGGYSELGSDVIHAFYVNESLQTSQQIYVLENTTEMQQIERMASVTLYSDGTAALSAPVISSYMVPDCTYRIEKDKLIIYAAIDENMESVFGVKSDEVLAIFEIAADDALVFQSSSIPLYADEGARYVKTTVDIDTTLDVIVSNFSSRYWFDYFQEENVPPFRFILDESSDEVFDFSSFAINVMNCQVVCANSCRKT